MSTMDNLAETTRIAQLAIDSLELVHAHTDADVWVDRARNSMQQALRFLELARTAELENGRCVVPEVCQR